MQASSIWDAITIIQKYERELIGLQYPQIGGSMIRRLLVVPTDRPSDYINFLFENDFNWTRALEEKNISERLQVEVMVGNDPLPNGTKVVGFHLLSDVLANLEPSQN